MKLEPVGHSLNLRIQSCGGVILSNEGAGSPGVEALTIAWTQDHLQIAEFSETRFTAGDPEGAKLGGRSRRQLRRRRAEGGGLQQSRRLLMIALGAAEPSLVERWISEGHLPDMRHLKEEGSYRRLESTADWLAGSIWSTFHTGTMPGNHARGKVGPVAAPSGVSRLGVHLTAEPAGRSPAVSPPRSPPGSRSRGPHTPGS